jgi:hypothetical protein
MPIFSRAFAIIDGFHLIDPSPASGLPSKYPKYNLFICLSLETCLEIFWIKLFFLFLKVVQSQLHYVKFTPSNFFITDVVSVKEVTDKNQRKLSLRDNDNLILDEGSYSE